MTPLRSRMYQDLRIRNYAPITIKIYIDLVARFARFFNKSPELLGPEDIRRYQVHLVQERKVSWTTLNQTVCAPLYAPPLRRSRVMTDSRAAALQSWNPFGA